MTAIVLVCNHQEKGESHLQQQRRPMLGLVYLDAHAVIYDLDHREDLVAFTTHLGEHALLWIKDVLVTVTTPPLARSGRISPSGGGAVGSDTSVLVWRPVAIYR